MVNIENPRGLHPLFEERYKRRVAIDEKNSLVEILKKSDLFEYNVDKKDFVVFLPKRGLNEEWSIFNE
jgi:hypothetical protein